MNNDKVIYFAPESIHIDRVKSVKEGVYNLKPMTTTDEPMTNLGWFRLVNTPLGHLLTTSSYRANLWSRLCTEHEAMQAKKRDDAIQYLLDNKVLTPYCEINNVHSYTAHRLDLEELGYHLMNVLEDSDREMDMLYGRRVDHIIVGHKFMAKWMSLQHLAPMEFRMPKEAGPKMTGSRGTIYAFSGIPVKIVPWFDGILMVPTTS